MNLKIHFIIKCNLHLGINTKDVQVHFTSTFFFFCNGSAFSSLFPHYATLILTSEIRPRSNPVFSFCVIMHLHSDSCTDAHKKVWDGLKLLDTVYFLWKRLSSMTQIMFFPYFLITRIVYGYVYVILYTLKCQQ